MKYGTIKLKVRRGATADYVQYDTSMFCISWSVASPPAPLYHILAHRSPTFIRDGKRLDIYSYPDGEEWIGSADRVGGYIEREERHRG